MLVLEAPFTVVLAHLFFREHLGRRVLAATVLGTIGALVLAVGAPAGGSALGVTFMTTAALSWAVDNLISRTLADADPTLIVVLKGSFGGIAAAVGGLVVGDSLPSAGRVGRIEAVGMDEGQAVKTGQLLFSISAKKLQQEVRRARAAAASARAELKAAQLERTNTKMLLEKAVVSAAEMALIDSKIEFYAAKWKKPWPTRG